jgi:type IV secretion system protein VirD4
VADLLNTMIIFILSFYINFKKLSKEGFFYEHSVNFQTCFWKIEGRLYHLQAQSQLKAIYKDNADTIAGNCDTTLFLGGKEKTTLKEMSELLGKETIDLYNTSENRGQSASYSLNYQKVGKELMSQDEIAVMDGGKAILQLRGVRPFISAKFDITKHRNYKYLSDFDKRNAFDTEKYLAGLRREKPIVKPDEPLDYYEIPGESEE